MGIGYCIARPTASPHCPIHHTDVVYSNPNPNPNPDPDPNANQVAQLTHHTDVVYSLLLAGGALFSSSADKTIRRYDTARHAQTLCWEAHHHSITCLAAAERGALLCSGAEDGKICLWRVGPDAAESVGSLSARPEGSAANLAVYTLAIEPVQLTRTLTLTLTLALILTLTLT